jgi:GNAT superfamily N-acetyltransferase
MEIRAFTDAVVDAAAELLAARHARERAAEPFLPAVDDFRPHVGRELARERAAGVAAERNGELVGYLIGRLEDDGRAVVDLAGCAVSEPEAVRDLYAALAVNWVAAGSTRHAAMIPVCERDLVDAWFRLAFGCQFMLAVRETAPEQPVDARVEIRPGEPADLPSVAAFDKLLWDHQTDSPSFSGLTVPDLDAFAAEWSDLWDDPELFTHFVAERDGSPVGHAILYRRPTGDLRVPEANIDLAHAATVPGVRGDGVGLALTAHVLAWAHEHGFRSMTTDWRSVNLLSSRFWPRRGWRPTHYRLYRSIP